MNASQWDFANKKKKKLMTITGCMFLAKYAPGYIDICQLTINHPETSSVDKERLKHSHSIAVGENFNYLYYSKLSGMWKEGLILLPFKISALRWLTFPPHFLERHPSSLSSSYFAINSFVFCYIDSCILGQYCCKSWWMTEHQMNCCKY